MRGTSFFKDNRLSAEEVARSYSIHLSHLHSIRTNNNNNTKRSPSPNKNLKNAPDMLKTPALSSNMA